MSSRHFGMGVQCSILPCSKVVIDTTVAINCNLWYTERKGGNPHIGGKVMIEKMFLGYQEAAKIEREINVLLDEYSITAENAPHWLAFVRTLNSTCRILAGVALCKLGKDVPADAVIGDQPGVR